MRGLRTAMLVLAVLAIAAVLVAVTAAGCGGSSNEGNGGTTGGDTPKQGGTMTVGYQGEPDGIDPAVNYTNEGWVIEQMMYNGLVKFDSGTGEAGTKIVPDIAEAMPTLSADAKTYTFKLRKGVKFAPPVDREVTAEDFKWTWMRMMRTPNAGMPSFYTGIVGAQDYYDGKTKDVPGIKVIDDYTLEIDLENPDGAFLDKLAIPFAWVIPKEWYAKYGNNISRHPLGAGQYMMESWTASTKMVLVKNPNYFDPSKVYADKWIFDFTPTPSRQVLLVQNGQIDIAMNNVPPAEYVRVMNDPNWKDNVIAQSGINVHYTFMNVKIKPFDNLKVRQAVCYAIDRDKLVKLQSGEATALNQMYPVGMPGHEENADYYPYDPDKAKQLLAEAGYPNGFKTTYWAHSSDPVPKLAQSIINDLKAIGIVAGLQLMEENAYWTKISAPAEGVPIGYTDWYQDYPDPSDWIEPLFSKASTAPGGSNSSNWWDQQVEDLSAQAAAMPASQERIDLYTQMQQIIMAGASGDPMFNTNDTIMFGDNVGGFYLHPVWITYMTEYWKK
jgi:peptide/nickel transport system substrate-binding protein